jgi:glyoxylase-like metal-dependent hydrolase (beta-lactamase superfamily II)
LTGAGNNTWLLDGAVPTLIDAGIGSPKHIESLAVQLGGRPLADVLVTHGHPDHASGVPALKAHWLDMRAHKWLTDEDAGTWDWVPLTAEEPIRAGDRALDVIFTPGHATDHVCFWDADRRELYGGDMLITGTTVIIPAGRGGNLRAYLASLERIAALDPLRIFPGHGPIIEDPSHLIEVYLTHRREREAQVRACLAAGVVNIEAIVAHIYPDISEAVRPAARLTVSAHLEKLREEEGASW